MPTINETLKQLEAQRNLAQKELTGLEAAINALKPLVESSISATAKTAAPVVAQPAKPQADKPAKRGKMSAAGRANIRAAVKARWAKVRAAKRLVSLKAFTSAPAKTATQVATPAKPVADKPAKKRTMSAAGRASIQAAVKARWAKVRAEKAKAKK